MKFISLSMPMQLEDVEGDEEEEVRRFKFILVPFVPKRCPCLTDSGIISKETDFFAART